MPGPGDAARILIVEDESLVAMYLEDTLEVLGYECCGRAASADEAISLAEAQQPAVALVDIGLRGSSDGIELARELGQRFGTAIVFLSGAGEPDTLLRAEATEPRGILCKPCGEQEIASMLEAILRSAPRT